MTRTAICVALAALGLGLADARAQGAFDTLGPSFGDETARRTFYGGFAVSGEAAYRDGDLLGVTTPGPASADFSLAARLDYALLPQVDLALVADLTGAAQAGRLGVSWVVVKPYWRNEATDYAVRLAVDPLSEGGLGFRQTDVAFLSTASLSPTVTSDLSLGLRRTRTGYSDVPEEVIDDVVDAAPSEAATFAYGSLSASTDPTRVRVVGQSVRGAWGYNVLFDPAGSRLSFGLAAEAGDYTLIETREPASPISFADGERGSEEESESNRIRSGVGWAQAGLEFSRPQYQLAPYVSVPLFTWADIQGEPVRHGPRFHKLRVGLRLTLR